ncbi:MAG: thiazole synthase [Candidatus Omnitrophica bacterium CG11_big_fil_rev_8_21_14_0_20_45_26]|uniref:Thiazole synthase n=1 Tax=Candidatus Abzuiibacterium crystallinum TaxID=1974748 RepID=A0A2H0LR04_9BACT|nr:MAG: thiazole synthase [Candidatus Omnitrophica bacterium CG11_big_fil_rev_8_21_14_0_20_45_26]PIW63439.1 MAG: thiazole synthase [Candidatus Omnitrophica bacterium CG12_big_fil_rev_8_21_14_0_65_45_16]
MLKIGKYEFKSRLITGTGKYRSFEDMVRALDASGCEMVTVAIGRVNLNSPQEKTLIDYIDRNQYTILPNTAGAYDIENALRIARLGRAAGMGDLVKLEVIGDPKTLLPDCSALLEATKILVKEGFIVMPYMTDDPVLAKKLEEAGAACVMPLAAPIGSGRGIQNPINIKFIKEAVRIPVIVDAGVGTASDAAVCMELGADGVLMNTAIACADNPVLMASAMREAVSAGRKAFLAGRIPIKEYGSASSPQEGLTGKQTQAGTTTV